MKDVKKGGLERALAGGKIAAAAARLAGRRVLGMKESDADGALGEAIARELDQMKGMAMKVGQIVSYFDGILPESAHAALRALQSGKTAVDFERMAPVIEAALGAPIDSLFESFDRNAIASASIGQVYRARYDGRAVAVKVQYPGIRATMRSDFSRLGGLSRVASLATAVDGAALVREVQARVDEECDYRREAENQKWFAAAFAADARIRIPAVVDARSCETVLTSEWIDGRDFYSFAAAASQPEKNAVAAVLVEAALRSVFVLGAVNADPHPGNYLFATTGEVAFLDFGCVRRFDPGFVDAQRRLVTIVLADRRRDFDEALVAAGMVGTRKGFDFDHYWALLRNEYAPYSAGRFRFEAEWLRRTMEHSKAGAPNQRKIAVPPQWIWLERLVWGLHAVLVRLGAEGDFASIMRAVMRSA